MAPTDPAAKGHVLQLFEPRWGGVPILVMDIVEGLLERGWRVTVGAPPPEATRRAPGEGATSFDVAMERLAASGAEHLPLVLHRPWQLPTSVRRLVQRCRDGVDLVHAHSSKGGALACLAGPLGGVPTVYSPHAWPFLTSQPPPLPAAYAAFERWAAGRRHATIVVTSEADRRAAEERRVEPRGGFHVSYTGLSPLVSPPPREEARRRLGLDPGETVAAWVGRYAAQKRPEDLGPLAERLRGSVRLAVLSEGLAGTEEAAALGEAGGVLVPVGTEPDLLYAAADMFVQTSAYEGFPVTVLEAMRAGLPTVAYGVGGLAEQVAEGSTGHLVEPGDLDGLARRARALAGEPERMRAMGEAARDRLHERFGFGAMLDVLEAAYAQARGRAATPPRTPPRPPARPPAPARR